MQQKRQNPNRAIKFEVRKYESDFQDGKLQIGKDFKIKKYSFLTKIQVKDLNDQFKNSGIKYVEVEEDEVKKKGRPAKTESETKIGE